MRHWYLNKETLMKGIFLLAACASILAVALICLFLFANGLPAIGKIGIFAFFAREKYGNRRNDIIRDSSYDFRKYLCNRRCDYCRCPDWNSDVQCLWHDSALRNLYRILKPSS